MQYHEALLELRPRISRKAWEFFDSGIGRWSLHDGRLISLSIGDGLDYRADGSSPFRINRQKTTVRIVFLSYEQDLLYTFDLRGVHRVQTDLVRSEPTYSLGNLFTYEIVAINDDLLQLGFLYDSGASIVAQFKKLIYRRQRIRRKYPVGEMYR